LSKHKTFAAHFSFFNGTPVCRGTQFGKHWQCIEISLPYPRSHAAHAVVGLGLGGSEARLKKGPYGEVIILSQP